MGDFSLANTSNARSSFQRVLPVAMARTCPRRNSPLHAHHAHLTSAEHRDGGGGTYATRCTCLCRISRDRDRSDALPASPLSPHTARGHWRAHVLTYTAAGRVLIAIFLQNGIRGRGQMGFFSRARRIARKMGWSRDPRLGPLAAKDGPGNHAQLRACISICKLLITLVE